MYQKALEACLVTVTVLGIDPGNEQSAFMVYDGTPRLFGKWCNDVLLRELHVGTSLSVASECAIETLKPRGMPTSFEEMQTQLWAGRFFEAWYQRQGGEKFALSQPHQMFRMDVKMHVCGRSTANDSNIRAALIDRFGGEAKAIGGVRCPTCKGKGWRGREHTPCPQWLHPPGPLYGITKDCWSALALAVTFADTRASEGV